MHLPANLLDGDLHVLSCDPPILDVALKSSERVLKWRWLGDLGEEEMIANHVQDQFIPGFEAEGLAHLLRDDELALGGQPDASGCNHVPPPCAAVR
jgi:hypothetical protein